MKIFNAKWCNKEHTVLDVVIDHPSYGNVPYTYSINSTNKSEIRTIIKNMLDSNQLEIAEYDDSFDLENLKKSVRSKRNRLLNETDKYMTLDYPISREDQDKLKEYRQALRDITKQEGFPENVIWPTKPV